MALDLTIFPTDGAKQFPSWAFASRNSQAPVAPLELRSCTTSNATMNRCARHFLLVLLAWCVVFQSTLWAMPAGCDSESVSVRYGIVADSGLPHAGHHHMPGMVMSQANDEMVAAQPTRFHLQHSKHLLSADCGCKCGGLHCGSSATVSATRSADQFSGDGFVYIRAELFVSPEAGHGLDLIRPPSRS